MLELFPMCRITPLVILSIVLSSTSPLRGEPQLPPAAEVDPAYLRNHCRRLLKALDELKTPLPNETTQALQKLLQEEPKNGRLFTEKVQELLDTHCLVCVTINPESRV